MFYGSGKSIQGKAKTLTIISIVISIIMGILIIYGIAASTDEPGLTVLAIFICALVAGVGIWFSTLWGSILYGYGVMVDRMEYWMPTGYAEAMAEAEQAYKQHKEEEKEKEEKEKQLSQAIIQSGPGWICPWCGYLNGGQSVCCQRCGVEKR